MHHELNYPKLHFPIPLMRMGARACAEISGVNCQFTLCKVAFAKPNAGFIQGVRKDGVGKTGVCREKVFANVRVAPRRLLCMRMLAGQKAVIGTREVGRVSEPSSLCMYVDRL